MYGRLQESDNNSKQNLEISNHKDQKRINNSNFNKNKYHKILNFKWLFIFSYIVYLILILMCHVPFMAEQFSNHEISDNVEYHLTFNCDGKQSHYDVVRFNKTIPGRIDLYYFPKTNTIRVDLDNIYELSIDCRSMYEDECKEIFGFDPKENSNYYKWFFIEKNHLNVNINSNTVLKNFELHDVPKPQVVIVDGDEWLLNKNYYYYSDKGLAISKFTNGTHSVDIYFKPTKMVGPIAQIISSKTYVQINESLSFDGSGSYDSKDNGKITNYLWDFGDGNYTTGKSLVEHSYSTPGVFGVVLTVINQDFNLGHAYLNITVLSSNGLHINGRVNDVSIPEDTYSFKLNLKLFEPYYLRPERDFYWYITREDHSLYILFGENNTDSEITINTLPDKFGNSKVILWLTDSLGNRVCQPLWINITPVNDHPIIFGAPDITLHYNVPYEFNYLPYITDVDTPINEVVLNSSDKTYTIVRGHNITYQYPKSMVHKIEYVILTVWDGEFESSYVVAVWITDDWVPNLVKPLPDVILKEGEIHKNYFDLDEYFIDPDNDTLYYSYGYTHVNVIINLDHTVDFYAPKDWNGKEMTTFRATDPSGALVEDIITVFVIGVNDPPDIRDVPNLVIRYDQDYVFDLTPYIYDEDNEMDELELTTSDPEHIRISRENNLKIILNYPYRPDIPYTHTVKLTISDGENSSFQYITVYVKENYPPVLIKQLPVIFLFEDIPQYDILNLYDYFQDNDSSMLYFKTLNNENILIEFDVDGTINIHSAENWSGKESITFRAIDPETTLIST